MTIPPTSGRKAVRLRNAALITELSHLYSLLMTAWIHDDSHDGNSALHPESGMGSDDDDDEKKLGSGAGAPAGVRARPRWAKDFRQRILPLALQISSLRQQTMTARWEGNIRGAWPAEEYDRLVDKESDILVALAQVRNVCTWCHA